MKRVGIVICNYNKKDMVIDCISAVLEQKYEDYELYVVDNGSTDGSAEAIKGKFEGKLTLIVNIENLGGTGGFNTGLKKALAAGHEYLMCIDNDAMLDENAVGELVRFLDEHDDVGMAASKVYHLEDPDYVQNFGQNIDFESFGTSVYYYNQREDGTMPPFVFCDAVPACSLMVRRSVAEEIGLLPSHCYLYWDDTEWCVRCNLAGHKVASVGSSIALHSMGAKLEYTTTFPTYYAIRNMIAFFIKYTPEDRLYEMCRTFLSDVYEEQFVGYFNDIKNKADTVMAAYDDAIHGVSGKAPEGRIHEVDRNPEGYRNLFESADSFYLYANGNPRLCEKVSKMAADLGFSDRLIECGDMETPDDGVCIRLCSSILGDEAGDLAQEALSAGRDDVLIDQNECIINSSDVRALREDYEQSRDLYIYSQMPLFMRQAQKLRLEAF